MRNKEEEIPGDEEDKPDQKKKEEEDRQIRRGRMLRRGRGFAVWGVLAWSNLKINNRAKLQGKKRKRKKGTIYIFFFSFFEK